MKIIFPKLGACARVCTEYTTSVVYYYLCNPFYWFENEETKATLQMHAVVLANARLHTQRRRWWCVFLCGYNCMEQWSASKEPTNAMSVCSCVLVCFTLCSRVCLWTFVCLCASMLRWAGEWTRINGKKFELTTKHSFKMLETFTIVSRNKKVFLCSNSTNDRKPVWWMLTNAHAHTQRERDMLTKTKRRNKTLENHMHNKPARAHTHTRTHVHIAASQIEKRLVCSTKVQWIQNYRHRSMETERYREGQCCLRWCFNGAQVDRLWTRRKNERKNSKRMKKSRSAPAKGQSERETKSARSII